MRSCLFVTVHQRSLKSDCFMLTATLYIEHGASWLEVPVLFLIARHSQAPTEAQKDEAALEVIYDQLDRPVDRICTLVIVMVLSQCAKTEPGTSLHSVPSARAWVMCWPARSVSKQCAPSPLQQFDTCRILADSTNGLYEVSAEP